MAGVYYFDSSAIVKRYVPERGSQWVKAITDPAEQNFVAIAEIGIVEVAAALARRRRRKEIEPKEYEDALTLFLQDVERQYEIAETSREIINLGTDLTRFHPLRGYDAIQLATALLFAKALEEEIKLIFVSADNQLCKAAEGEGLPAMNPDLQEV